MFLHIDDPVSIFESQISIFLFYFPLSINVSKCEQTCSRVNMLDSTIDAKIKCRCLSLKLFFSLTL